jgi:hypothetical protein
MLMLYDPGEREFTRRHTLKHVDRHFLLDRSKSFVYQKKETMFRLIVNYCTISNNTFYINILYIIIVYLNLFYKIH